MDSNTLDILETFHKQGLQDKGMETFADMCLKTLYQDYAVPDTVSYLVHYTSLDALLSMIGIQAHGDPSFPLSSAERPGDVVPTARGGFLRVYDTFYSNDPNEGYFFVNSINQSNRFRKNYKAIWDLFEQRSELPAYLASLVCVKNVEDADDLVFWRTYGRDGTGCALVFPMYCFENISQLYQVRYGESKVKSCINKLRNMFEAYSKIPGAPPIRSIVSSRDINKAISETLSPLVYLHKSKDYSYEKEARIIVPFSDISPDALYCQISPPADFPPRWRHFAQLPGLELSKLLLSNSSVILGPTVDSPENIKFVLQQILDRFRPLGPKVKISKISYRT